MIVAYLILHRHYASRGFVTISPRKRRWIELASVVLQILVLGLSCFMVYVSAHDSRYQNYLSFGLGNIGNLVGIPMILIHSAYYWYYGDGKTIIKNEQAEAEHAQNQDQEANREQTNVETLWVIDKNRGCRAGHFILLEILVIMNFVLAFFMSRFSIYDCSYDCDKPDRDEFTIVIALQLTNAMLLLGTWILCYFYSTNLIWWLPLLVINIIGHRYYPRPVKIQRVGQHAQHEGIPVERMVQFLNNSRSWGTSQGVRQVTRQTSDPPPTYEQAMENGPNDSNRVEQNPDTNRVQQV